MARLEHHAAFAFVFYYIIYISFIDFIIPGWIVLLTFFFGIFPDLDTIYWKLKGKKINMQFQHHLYYWTHWPLIFTPLILIFFISLVFNFYPLFFLIPVISLYCGHFIPDSIATGDGIMWFKIPWRRDRFARYLNLFSSKTDGYHGNYWNARFIKTIFSKIADLAVIFTIIILIFFYLYSKILDFFYIISLIFLVVSFLFNKRKIAQVFYNEPPQGRYADYRKNLNYINGLSQKNKIKHYNKYSNILN